MDIKNDDDDDDDNGRSNRHYFLHDEMAYEPSLSYLRKNPTQHGFKALVFGSEALVFCGRCPKATEPRVIGISSSL